MLNFRNTNILFISLLGILIGIDTQVDLAVYPYLILFIIYSLILFYGCYFIDSNFFIKIICSANTEKKEIAISFDDGPAKELTQEILQILNNENVKAAFFCIGSRIEGNEGILNQIKSEGHIIGNHSYSHHFWFDMFSSKKMLDDLKRTDQAIEKITGLRPKLFRPPYGVTNPNLKKAIIRGAYTPIGWSVRSMDTVIKDKIKLLDRINRSIKPGAIFLFHDTSETTLQALPEFIKEVKNRGFSIIPLDKLLHLNSYA